jgi:hypothetical protein
VVASVVVIFEVFSTEALDRMEEKQAPGSMIDPAKTLSRIRSIRDSLPSPADLEEIHFSSLRILRDKGPQLEAANSDISGVAEKLIKVLTGASHISSVLALKIWLMLDAAVKSTEDDNPLALAVCSRNVIEISGSIKYLTDKIDASFEHLKKQKRIDKINIKLDQTIRDIDRIFYGSSFFSEISTEEQHKPIHVNDLIKKIQKDMNGVENHYGFLCDFVHPNFGSNYFLIDGKLGEGRVVIDTKENADITSRILFILLNYAEYFGEIENELIYVLVNIDMSIKNCLDENATVNNIFQKVKSKYTGDGKTPATGIHFVRARTHAEHITLQLEFVNNLGIDRSTRRNDGFSDDNFLVESYLNGEERIWFKVPIANDGT